MSAPIEIIITAKGPAITIGSTFDGAHTFTISPFIDGVSNAGVQVKDETTGMVVLTIDGSGNIKISGDLTVAGSVYASNLFPPESGGSSAGGASSH